MCFQEQDAFFIFDKFSFPAVPAFNGKKIGTRHEFFFEEMECNALSLPPIFADDIAHQHASVFVVGPLI
jgi:hypothetical protein